MFRRTALILTLAFALSSAAAAQNAGRLFGEVVDESGAPLADVTATLFSPGSDFEMIRTTNKKGRFGIAVVDMSRDYVIRLEKEGYQPQEQPVQFSVGDANEYSWTLAVVAPVSGDAIEVEGSGAAIELYNAGAAAYNAGDFETALAKFEAAIAEDETLVGAYEIAGALHLENRSFERTLELADQALALNPSSLAAKKLQHDGLMGLDRWQEAVPVLQEIIAVEPSPAMAARAYNLSLACVRNHDPAKATELLLGSIEMDPTLLQAQGLLGRLYVQDGKYQEALALSDGLLEAEPGNVAGLSLRYDGLIGIGDTEGAAAAFEQLKQADPEAMAKMLLERGELLFGAGQAVAAVDSFRQVVQLQPENAFAHYKLGLALLSAENTAEGKTHLQRFLELDPGHPEAAAAQEMLQYLD